MALKNINEPDPLAELTAEARKHMEEIKGALDRSDGDLDAMEELGLDVSKLRDKVAWGRKAREIILKRLT